MTTTANFMSSSTWVYDTEYEDDTCNKTSVINFGQIATPMFLSIVTILSLLSNILVLLILVKYENLKSITNTFIFNLAISDLLFTLGLPFWIYYHITNEWTLGELTCKLVSFVFYVGFYSSSILLIVMTIQRYVAVMSPLSDIVSSKGSFSIIAPVIVWVISILAASPVCIFSKEQEPNHCGHVEKHWKLVEIYMQNAVFIWSSLVFVFCYSQILYKLLRPTPQRRNKTLKLIFILMVVFFVGWAPFNIVIFLQSIQSSYVNSCDLSKQLDYAFYISRLLAFSHCCHNPVFYVFVGVKFKTHLKNMLNSWRHKNRALSRHNRATIISITSGEDVHVLMV